MAIVQILTNGNPGPVLDHTLGQPVTFSNIDNTPGITYQWSLVEDPAWTPALVNIPTETTNPAANTFTITPLKKGTYLIRLTLNPGTPGEVSGTMVLGIRHQNIRIPSIRETIEAGIDGWGPEVQTSLEYLDNLVTYLSAGYGSSADLSNVSSSTESAGVLNKLTRADHKHDVDVGAPPDIDSLGATGKLGVSPALARADHRHGTIPQDPGTEMGADFSAWRLHATDVLVQNKVLTQGIIVIAQDTDMSLVDPACHVVLCDTNLDPITLTLPPAGGTLDGGTNRGRVLRIKNLGEHDAIIEPLPLELVDGLAVISLNHVNDAVDLISDGAAWWVLSVSEAGGADDHRELLLGTAPGPAVDVTDIPQADQPIPFKSSDPVASQLTNPLSVETDFDVPAAGDTALLTFKNKDTGGNSHISAGVSGTITDATPGARFGRLTLTAFGNSLAELLTVVLSTDDDRVTINGANGEYWRFDENQLTAQQGNGTLDRISNIHSYGHDLTIDSADTHDIVFSSDSTPFWKILSTGTLQAQGTNRQIKSVADATDPNDAVNLSQLSSAVTGLLDLKGTLDCSANPNYPPASKGDAYVVSVTGKIGGIAGVTVDVGDFVFATADNAGGDQAAVGTSWTVLEHNIIGLGTVAGLDYDTDGTLAADSDSKVATQKATKTYVGTSITSAITALNLGTASTLTSDTDGTLAANSDSRVATQKATKTYADTKIASSALDTDGTLAANSDSRIASQKATKTYADTKIASTALDTDITLSANSDSRVASQKATKAYVDALYTSKEPDNVVTKVANYNAATKDIVLCDTSSGGFTVTLPTAVGYSGYKIAIVKTAASNNVTVATTSGQTINGSSTLTVVSLYDSVVLFSDGSNWRIL